MKSWGWGLVIFGGALQILETTQKATATLNNTTFDKTPIGKLIAPVENVLPLPLGWALLGTGAAVLYFC